MERMEGGELAANQQALIEAVARLAAEVGCEEIAFALLDQVEANRDAAAVETMISDPHWDSDPNYWRKPVYGFRSRRG